MVPAMTYADAPAPPALPPDLPREIVVQRAGSQGEALADATPAATVTQSASAEPAHPGEGAGGQNLDELARKIYDRIRDKLQAELKVDRERLGRLTDIH